MIKGKQSIAFEVSPYLEESASVVGKKEGEGPLGGMFDIVAEEDLFGENTLKCIFNFQLARVNSSLIEITSAHIYCH